MLKKVFTLKFIILTVIGTLLSLSSSFGQEVFKLTIKQPPPLTITISEGIDASKEEVVNLDTLFNVEGNISYAREWKFNDGVQLQTVDNPIVTLTTNGVFYLTIVDENGCTAIDSIALNVATDIKDIYSDQDNQASIHVFPNPNSGTFNILISDCLPGYSAQVLNSLGVQLLNRDLNCNNNDYRETIILPRNEPGMYFLLIKKDKRIVYTKKVIILK